MIAKEDISVLRESGPVLIAINDVYAQNEKEHAKIIEKITVVQEKLGLNINITPKNRVASTTLVKRNTMPASLSLMLVLYCFVVIC